jgi:hypothetical protein
MKRTSIYGILCACLLLVGSAIAAEITVPDHAIAGSKLSLASAGSGEATLVLVGPGHIVSKKIQLGTPIEIAGEDVADAGRYLAILRTSGGEIAKSFYVSPATPARLSFVAHPSRAPVAQKDSITGAVYAFDAYDNLVLQPLQLSFKLSQSQNVLMERKAASQNGVASVSLDAPRHEGALQFQASAGDVQTTRIVRVVADEPCTLSIHAIQRGNGVQVETDPVKDCSGNLVPDGTLVTFTEYDGAGRSTVDAAVKKGIARANLPANGDMRISAASGVALGNELRLRAGK